MTKSAPQKSPASLTPRTVRERLSASNIDERAVMSKNREEELRTESSDVERLLGRDESLTDRNDTPRNRERWKDNRRVPSLQNEVRRHLEENIPEEVESKGCVIG